MTDTDNSQEVANQIEEVAKQLTSPALLKKAGLMATEMIREHIYHGSNLAPLRPATVAYRGQGRPLQDTGGLRDSISYEIHGKKAIVGTTNKYAAVHNNGAEITAHNRTGYLFIPAQGTRQLERRYGKMPRDVISGLKSAGFNVYRPHGCRVVMYQGKRKNSKPHVLYYLKQSVKIPAREFFYLTAREMDLIAKEVGNEYFSSNVPVR